MLTIAPCHFPIIRVQSQALTRSSLHRGNVNSAEDSHVRHMGDTLLSSVAQRSLRRLDQTRHHLTPGLGTLTDLARSKSELVAENALLRKPLIILRRQVKRPASS